MDSQHATDPIEPEYPKLVRDNIPRIIKEKDGIDAGVRVAENDEEFLAFLLKKLVEEAVELRRAASREQGKEELADVLEIIDALLDVWGVAESDIREIQAKKRSKNGGFEERFIMRAKPQKLKRD